MSAPDCLALANFMYNQSEFRRAAQWYRIALHFIQEPRNGIAAEVYGPKGEDLKKMFVISRLQEGKLVYFLAGLFRHLLHFRFHRRHTILPRWTLTETRYTPDLFKAEASTHSFTNRM